MSGYYDDNFGNWDMSEGEEMVEFYHQLQKTNVEKVCKNCKRKVFIQPHYAICNSCAEKIERGGDI
jgi:hypothetical protein